MKRSLAVKLFQDAGFSFETLPARGLAASRGKSPDGSCYVEFLGQGEAVAKANLELALTPDDVAKLDQNFRYCKALVTLFLSDPFWFDQWFVGRITWFRESKEQSARLVVEGVALTLLNQSNFTVALTIEPA